MFIREAFNSALGELVAKVTLNPNGGELPGEGALQKLINGGAKLCLLICLGAFVWGAAQWALGNRSHNYSHSSDGKARMATAIAGVFAIGAAAAILNFFFGVGSEVR